MTSDKEYYTLFIGGFDNNRLNFREKGQPPKEFVRIQRDFEKNNPQKVIVQSGEPTIHPDFFRIISYLLKKGCKEIVIRTNGRMFNYPKFVSKIKNIPQIRIYVELLGSTRDLHESITNIPGSYEQALQGIKNLRKARSELNVIIPLIDENLADIQGLLTLLSGYDISSIILTPINFSMEKFAAVQDALKCLDLEKRIMLGFENLPFCIFPEQDYYKQIFSPAQEYGEKCKACYKRYACPGMKGIGQFSGLINPFTGMKSRIEYVKHTINSDAPQYISIEDIYHVLYYFDSPKGIWDAILDLGYPIPFLIPIIKELEKAELLEIKGKIRNTLPQKQRKTVIDTSHERLVSDPSVCQLLVSQEHLEDRVGYIRKTCPSGGKLAVLGDDDFMSINLASIGLFDEIVVLEIDRKIVEKINSIAKKHSLPVTCLQHDLKKDIPRRFRNKFDAVYTDSPYYPNGFSLFISRAVDMLKKEQMKHIFSSFSCEMPVIDVELHVQGIINDMRLFIERKSVPANNIPPDYFIKRYDSIGKIENALDKKNKALSKLDKWYLAVLGRKEMLFHFLTTEKTTPRIKGDFKGEIYYEQDPLDYYIN